MAKRNIHQPGPGEPLPLLRRPRPNKPKASTSTGLESQSKTSLGSGSSCRKSKQQSNAGSTASVAVVEAAVPPLDLGGEESQRHSTPILDQWLGNTQNSRDDQSPSKMRKAMNRGEDTDMAVWCGDTQVKPRYVPQQPPHYGPPPFPAGKVRHRDDMVPPTQRGQLESGNVTHVDTRIVPHDSIGAVVQYGREAVPAHGMASGLHDDYLARSTTSLDNFTDDIAAPGYPDLLLPAHRIDEDEITKRRKTKAETMAIYEKMTFSSCNYNKMPGWKGPAGKKPKSYLRLLTPGDLQSRAIERIPATMNHLQSKARVYDEARWYANAAASGQLIQLSMDREEQGTKHTLNVDDDGKDKDNQEKADAKEGESTMADELQIGMQSLRATVYRDGEAKHFCGQVRNQSPFADDGRHKTLSPAEAAVLHCRLKGGRRLSLKAYFIPLEELPPLNALSRLTFVNLSFNCLRNFPAQLFALPCLSILSLRDNPIPLLPDDLDRMQVLTSFCMSFCLLTYLPDCIGNMSLQSLDVQHNTITYLPDSIGNLKKLTSLNITGNRVAAMPLSMERLPRLNELYCEDNFMTPLFWKELERKPARVPYEPFAPVAGGYDDEGADGGDDYVFDADVLPVADRRRPPKAGYVIAKPPKDKSAKRCDHCQENIPGGGGLGLIRAPRLITHYVARLPFRYNVCQQSCYKALSDKLRETYNRGVEEARRKAEQTTAAADQQLKKEEKKKK